MKIIAIDNLFKTRVFMLSCVAPSKVKCDKQIHRWQDNQPAKWFMSSVTLILIYISTTPSPLSIHTHMYTYRFRHSGVLRTPLHVKRLDFCREPAQQDRLIYFIRHFPLRCLWDVLKLKLFSMARLCVPVLFHVQW